MWATIEDEAFLAQVRRGRAFHSGDFLECHLRVEQSVFGGKLHADYDVTEVRRHIERSRDEPLGDMPPGD